MPRPTRASDENPLIVIVMLVLLVGGAVAGIRHALREQPIAHGRYAAVSGDTDLRPSPNRSGSPTGFVDAWKRLPQDATALQRAVDQGFDDAARALGDEELTWVKQIMARTARSRDDYTDDEISTLRRLGFGSWVEAQSIRWSQEDPTFKSVSSAVWSRSPRARDNGDLTGLAVRWGESNRSTRQELLALIRTVENNGRQLTDSERAKLTAFAGAEYLANRP